MPAPVFVTEDMFFDNAIDVALDNSAYATSEKSVISDHVPPREPLGFVLVVVSSTVPIGYNVVKSIFCDIKLLTLVPVMIK